MPRANRPCAHPQGCGSPARPGRSLCDTHDKRRDRQRERTARRPSAAKRGYNTKGHQAFRRAVLTRDPHCTCTGCPKCTNRPTLCLAPSTDADHHPRTRQQIIADGDNPNSPAYGRGLCHSCHSHWTATLHGGFGHDMKTVHARAAAAGGHVTIVCGPPCAGKTTYVRTQASPGDLIIDLDTIQQALTTSNAPNEQHSTILPYALTVRDALTTRLTHDPKRPTSWVVTTKPPDQLGGLADELNATVHPIVPPAAECIARLRRDPAGRDIQRITDLITHWPGYLSSEV